jgi:ABC-type transport system involved in multi-copper enzyme maturation permease subunit
LWFEANVNAIIQREFFSLIKTPQALLIQLAVAFALCLTILLTYPSDGVVSETGKQSEFVFRMCGYGLLFAMLLVVPAFPATGIVREKSSGTLALLLNSPLHPASIYFGKFLGVAFYLLLLLSLSLPAAFTCYSMGGISIQAEIMPMYLVLIVAAVLYIAIGMLISTLSQSADAALRLTYFATFVVAFLSLLPWLFLQGKDGLWPAIAQRLRFLSPVTPMAELMGHGDIGDVVASTPVQGLKWFLIYSSLLAVVFIVANIIILSRRMFDLSRSAGRVTDDRSLVVRASRRLFFVVDPNRRKKGIGFFINPVFVKEFRTRKFGRSHWLLRLISLCAIGSIALTYFATNSTRDWPVPMIAGTMVLLQISLVILIAPSLASGLISSELESGGWNLLMLTPMRPLKVVVGKLLSVLWIVGLILLATMPGYMVLVWIEPTLKPQVWRVVITLLLASGLTIALSAMISSFFRRTAISTAVAYSVTVCLFAGTMLIWLGADRIFGYPLVRAALLLNPVSGALEAFQTEGFQQYQLLPGNWWVTTVGTLFCLCVFLIRTSLLMRPR